MNKLDHIVGVNIMEKTRDNNEPNFVQTMVKPRDKPGPCDWKIENWMDKRRLYISGTCKTYTEARGLVGRIGKAMSRAYKLGLRNGRKSAKSETKGPTCQPQR